VVVWLAAGGDRGSANETLAPGGFQQHSGLLATAAIDEGYVRVRKTTGNNPVLA
jgi:hypothetical protein